MTARSTLISIWPFADPVIGEVKADTQPVDCHGPAGTVVLWHTKILHIAGQNTSDNIIRQASIYAFLKTSESLPDPLVIDNAGGDIWRDWSDEVRAPTLGAEAAVGSWLHLPFDCGRILKVKFEGLPPSDPPYDPPSSKKNFGTLSEAFTADDRSLLSVSFGYKLNEFVEAVINRTTQFELDQATGQYESLNTISFMLNFTRKFLALSRSFDPIDPDSF
jgi:hypothetical protein